MPLLDHFRPPLSERRPWDSFTTTWASALADALNHGVLPPGYLALEHVHAGAPIEIEVGTYSEEQAAGTVNGPGGTATATRTVWVPAAPPLVFRAEFPEQSTVEIVSTERGRTLVAAVELVSPGNKDRESKRRLFAARCATYLARGVGLVIVDVVTVRLANLHNDLMALLGLEERFRMATEQTLYAVAYRPVRRGEEDQVDAWPMPLQLGRPLPTVPLSLAADLCVPVNLETSYRDACQRRRLDEVLG